jgi:hypothetical protein
MKKIEVLAWGIAHIAENHHFDSYNSLNSEDDEKCCGILGDNIPTTSDVEMMCDDLGIDRDYIDVSIFGICVTMPEDWDKVEKTQR